jgi:hypothetical protein
MAREIEIEIPDQSDIIPPKLLKGKKQAVEKLIDDLPAPSPNYTPISISYRQSMPHEELQPQTPILLFQLFFSSYGR